jgi:hypothetical protein
VIDIKAINVKLKQRTKPLITLTASVILTMLAANSSGIAAAVEGPEHVLYRTVKIDGFSIFYREAGPKDAPTILLLHGLPSSSRMFEPLFARLSDRFHLVAPD